jgi:hypothetical protein
MGLLLDQLGNEKWSVGFIEDFAVPNGTARIQVK